MHAAARTSARARDARGHESDIRPPPRVAVYIVSLSQGAVKRHGPSALAPGAERRRPQVDRVRGHELSPALHARLAPAPVHLELELKSSAAARAGAVVSHGRAR